VNRGVGNVGRPQFVQERRATLRARSEIPSHENAGKRILLRLETAEDPVRHGAAHFRKVAARLILRFPEVVEPLREGKLCIASIVELARVMTPENRWRRRPPGHSKEGFTW
jgi:hypothetical protein